MIVILGDFNARILTDPGLPRHVGPNIFRGEHPLGTYSEEVLDNRDRFLDFLLQQDLDALITLQNGPPNTHKQHSETRGNRILSPIGGNKLRTERLRAHKKQVAKPLLKGAAQTDLGF